MAALTGAALALAAGAVRAEDGAAMAARFGALEDVRQISLSPSGNQVAFLKPNAGSGVTVIVADFATGQTRAVLNAANPGEELRWCRWASETRLMCQLYVAVNRGDVLLGATRYVIVRNDGTGQGYVSSGLSRQSQSGLQDGGSVLDWDIAGKPGHVLMTRTFVPSSMVGSNIERRREGLGVEDVDLESGKRELVEAPHNGAVRYITDGRGHVRLMALRGQSDEGYIKDEVRWFYRARDDDKWLPFITAKGEDSDTPLAVDPDKNLAYVLGAKDGFHVLYGVALDGTGTRQVVLEQPGIDIDDVTSIGRNGRVVGATYATEKRVNVFFDPELRKLGAALGKALPGQPLVEFVDSSEDEGRLLLLASSDSDPGLFYRYDKTTHQLEKVLPIRQPLAQLALGKMIPVTYPAGDGSMVPAYLTLPPGIAGPAAAKGLPAIVMPHGGPGARDEWGFDWLVQYFAVRGYAVLQPNYRGSTGYGSGWYQKNGFKSWRLAISDIAAAGHWLTAQGIADPAKLAIVGWSYGGYAALQSGVTNPGLFKAIVAVAPVTDLDRLREEFRDFANFRLADAFIGHGDHIEDGSPARHAAAITVPVLMFHGERDMNVGIAESRLMADRLKDAGKQVTLVTFPGLDHQLASAAARTRLLADSDAFLRKAMGM
ncbi:alpha/beta hydrolase family protein [Novosphingobium sp.]|uniref:alpha/beta hydrolase family protein n=1 Tax=Novosphingobium sp. TaxID=1874826 RepID=UPI003BAA721C